MLCLFSALLTGDSGHTENMPWFCMDFLSCAGVFCFFYFSSLKLSCMLMVSYQLLPTLTLFSFYTGVPTVVAKPHHPSYCSSCGAVPSDEWLGGQWGISHFSLIGYCRLIAIRTTNQKPTAAISSDQDLKPGYRFYLDGTTIAKVSFCFHHSPSLLDE